MRIIFLFLCLIALFFVSPVRAANDSFVTVINPIRGEDFWDIKEQAPQTAVYGEIEILKKYKLSPTWLIRFDALNNKQITDLMNFGEKGLFLEVTPSWTTEAGVTYRQSKNWHDAGSAFLTGYERGEREKLIEAAFEKFKSIFGNYPTSVGAWWIDAYSLSYMQKKYGITGALIVADQYSTDNYQIWGQYFSTPYFPDNKNALHPAQNKETKIPVVLVQWAARDPLNGYGNGVFESTFSVQANDYIDFHKLDTSYFNKLIDLYINPKYNDFGQVVVGLENSYQWSKYKNEYENQIKILSEKRDAGKLRAVSLKEFSSWYQNKYPNISPSSVVVSDDPLGSFKKVVWFMNPYYRAGWFFNADGSVFRDIRQYIENDEEICFQKRCDSVNFATFATRVLDEVTYGNKWVIDDGKISNFEISKVGEKVILNYLNEAGKSRTIEFLPRDIGVDNNVSSIDGTILNAIKISNDSIQKSKIEEGLFSWSIFSVLSKTVKFLLFYVFLILIPGLLLTYRLNKDIIDWETIFLASVWGLVSLTLVFYSSSLLHLRFIVLLYGFLNFLLFLKSKKFIFNLGFDKFSGFLILIGTIFQNIPTFRSGLNFSYGLGFWGPNTHDGIWHISLINELIKGLPIENPIFSGNILRNYHFFYDLMIATAAFITKIPVSDLVFRFFPIIFSLLLGIGTYFLAFKLLKNKIAVISSLYFVYFSGSFGWIVDYIKNKTLGGESAFWANQSISFNLNPPFAISLLIIIAFMILLINETFFTKRGILISTILLGALVGFKSYAAVLALGAFSTVSLLNLLRKQFIYFYILIFSLILTVVIFVSNFDIGEKLIIFSPFWLIHSMIDSTDRIGWVRLSLARIVGQETGNWFKFISSEIVGLIIFILGNLGMRFLSFISIFRFKGILGANITLFIFTISLLSFTIPILFIQSGNPWNTIQFSYYGLYIAAVISGEAILYFKLRLLKITPIIIATVLILTPINSITTASYYTGNPHAVVSIEENEGLRFLSKQENGVVLTYPYDLKIKNKFAEPRPLLAYDSTAYVSALANKPVYLEDEPQNQILLTDYKKRVVASKDFFLAQSEGSKDFLRANKIKYIYIPTIYNLKLDEKLLNLESIFENEQVVIYKVK